MSKALLTALAKKAFRWLLRNAAKEAVIELEKHGVTIDRTLYKEITGSHQPWA